MNLRDGILAAGFVAAYLAAAAVPNVDSLGSAAIGGTSTWYCGQGSPCTRGYQPGDLVAAAGSELQYDGWRGSWVTVHHGDRHVTVKLVDVCACEGTRVIDLSAAAFSELAPTSRGVIPVTVVLDTAPRLPATDTAPGWPDEGLSGS